MLRSEERRKHYRHRFPVLVPIEFTVQAAEEDILEGFTTNISAAGLCILTANKLEEQSDVMLRDNRHIPFRTGQVRWIREAKEGQYNVGLFCDN